MAMLDCQLLQQRWPQFQVVAYFPRDEHAGEIWARVTKDDAGTEELIRDLDEEALHRLDTEHADRAQQVRLNERFTFLYIGRPGPDRRATIWLCRDGRPAETTVDEDPALRERVAPGAETLTYRQGARNGTHQI